MWPSRSYWNDTTSALQPKITSKGIELHVCTINKSAHTKKKSGNLLYALRITKYLIHSTFKQLHHGSVKLVERLTIFRKMD